MMKLQRPAPPPEWDVSTPEIREKLRGFYAKILPKAGKDKSDIPDRWNDKNKDGKPSVREALLAMSNNHCAYCGKYITNEEMHVEHYFPKADFREIAYAWRNYLPSCVPCNLHRKRTFVPASLQDKRIIDEILLDPIPANADTEPSPDFVLDANYSVHQATNDRIIDPSFDDPDEHLEFDAFSCEYLSKTEIGRITIEHLLAQVETRRAWSNLVEEIGYRVAEGASKERIERFIKNYGYEYVGWKAYQYWSERYAKAPPQS